MNGKYLACEVDTYGILKGGIYTQNHYDPRKNLMCALVDLGT